MATSALRRVLWVCIETCISVCDVRLSTVGSDRRRRLDIWAPPSWSRAENLSAFLTKLTGLLHSRKRCFTERSPHVSVQELQDCHADHCPSVDMS
ncbi:hypothetical protein T4E_539 [Trichinella pseudospiralis]|uniref:Uncharacterized protein n=1 Tax=Trichinella pseudospiralis TaxID=6337 RepID=A0A0V0Y5H4_TRIPS|nr:hypothetical protein T4E_539 [Trichinella pseudospiralis]